MYERNALDATVYKNRVESRRAEFKELSRKIAVVLRVHVVFPVCPSGIHVAYTRNKNHVYDDEVSRTENFTGKKV